MPRINFNPKSIGTALGMGALCATLTIAPIATNLVIGSEATYAAGAYACSGKVPMPSSWKNVEISKDNYADISNSAKDVKGLNDFIKLQNAYESATDAEGTISDTLVTEAKAAGALDNFSDPSTDPGFAGHYSYQAVIKAATETAGYDANAELQAAVAKAEEAHAKLVNDYKNTITAIIPSINISNATDIHDLQSDVFNYYGEDAYSDYLNLAAILPITDSEISSWGLGYKDYAYELVCSATRLDPSFKVSYLLSSDPFGGTTNDNTGNTDNNNTPGTTTIENGDQNVKVSGVNININYTLNVNPVSTDDLKLTSDDFKSSLNQSFYDIFIKDNQNNVISNTGEVEVSIKLPDNMNPKNDFVVYYVPVAANGEYLTDQAEAIKGVKVSDDGWLTFTTNHFSVYGIVEYTKGKAPSAGIVAQSESSAINTSAKVFAGIASALTVAGVSIVARRQVLRKKNK